MNKTSYNVLYWTDDDHLKEPWWEPQVDTLLEAWARASEAQSRGCTRVVIVETPKGHLMWSPIWDSKSKAEAVGP